MAKTATNLAPDTTAPNDPVEGIQWWSMRSKRSEALPKHSLFGTALENIDKESLKNIEGRYMPEGYIRPAPERYPLPEHLKERIPGREALESTRRELNQQKNILTAAEQQLKIKAEKAFSFSEAQNRPSHTSYSQSSRPSWLTAKDLEHSRDINIVGLNQRGSFNRDKYGSKPKRHNYSLIGDILAKNMDFTSPRTAGAAEKLDAYNQGRDAGWGKGRHLPYDLMKQSKPSNKIQSVIDLPPNIRHKFGSKNCDRLLSDENLVSMTLDRQKTMSGPPRPSKKENVKGLPVDLEGNYESLGQATRYNVFPGLTTGHTISQTQKEFNDEVHLRRVPNPDEFRYQRDELSTWSEHNVLRERMKKAWDDTHPLGGKKQ